MFYAWRFTNDPRRASNYFYGTYSHPAPENVEHEGFCNYTSNKHILQMQRWNKNLFSDLNSPVRVVNSRVINLILLNDSFESKLSVS